MPAVKHDGVLDWFWLTNMMYYLPLAHATPMVTFDTGILNWTADCCYCLHDTSARPSYESAHDRTSA